MKFEKWALVAESVGTIAIVASLIVLVIQVRDSNEATRTASFDAVTQSFNDWRSDLIDVPELFELYHNYKSGIIPSADQADNLQAAVTRWVDVQRDCMDSTESAALFRSALNDFENLSHAEQLMFNGLMLRLVASFLRIDD